jgi:spore germination protein KA
MDTQTLGAVLQDNKVLIKDKLNHSADLIERSFKFGGVTDISVFYMSGVTDTAAIHEYVIKPLLSAEAPQKKIDITDYILENVLWASEVKAESSLDTIADMLLYGDCAVIIDGGASALMAAHKKWEKRSIAEPPTSAVLKGPREGFTEDMKGNTVQLRRRLRSPDLIFEQMRAGRYTNTNICVAYMKGIADENIVNKAVQRIKAIDIDGVIDSCYVQQFLEERRGSIFKQINNSEKPDIVAARMLEVRIAVIVDGSPIVLTLPYMLLEDFQNSQDYYMRRDESTLRIFLRAAAYLIGLLLPAFYVAVEVYHYDILPIKMLITLSNAIHGTPFPPLQEMLLVTVIFMLIYDASVMMPRYVGMAVSIVGALVLGETAVKAGIISSPTVLIVAISMLCGQLVPDQVGLTNLLKLGFIFAGGLLGVFGIAAALVMLLGYMATLDSYGTPFLAPFSPFIRKDMKDALFKESAADMETRPYSLPGVNKKRLKKNERNRYTN